MPPLSKGKRVKIPAPGRGYLSGDTSAMGDVGESPGESCLFSLTPSADPGIGLSGDREGWAGKRGTFCPVRVRSRRPLKIPWTCFWIIGTGWNWNSGNNRVRCSPDWSVYRCIERYCMTPRQRDDDNNLSVGNRNHLKLGIEPESWLQSHELGF